jgi:hypothetical protein
MGQRHAPAALYPQDIEPVPIVQEAGWALGPVWTGAGNLARTGIRSPDHPSRSQSLYRLCYPAKCEVPILQSSVDTSVSQTCFRTCRTASILHRGYACSTEYMTLSMALSFTD